MCLSIMETHVGKVEELLSQSLKSLTRCSVCFWGESAVDSCIQLPVGWLHHFTHMLHLVEDVNGKFQSPQPKTELPLSGLWPWFQGGFDLFQEDVPSMSRYTCLSGESLQRQLPPDLQESLSSLFSRGDVTIPQMTNFPLLTPLLSQRVSVWSASEKIVARVKIVWEHWLLCPNSDLLCDSCLLQLETDPGFS